MVLAGWIDGICIWIGNTVVKIRWNVDILHFGIFSRISTLKYPISGRIGRPTKPHIAPSCVDVSWRGLVMHHGGGLSLWRRILIKMRVVSLTSYSLDFVQFIGLFIMPVWLYLVRIKNNSDFQCSDWIKWVMWHGSRGITWYEFYVISVGHHFGGTFHAKPRRLYWIKLNRFKPNEPKPKTITTNLPKIFDPIHAARKCSNSSRKKIEFN